MSKLLLNEVFGSGGVLLSKGKVLLIHKATEDEWTLPHSVLGEDQGLRDSAVSEVSKYVKFECSIKDYFGSHVYSTNEGVTHRVFYWVMKSSTGGTTGGTLENLGEIDEVRWVRIDKVPHYLTQLYANFFQRHVGRLQQKN